MKNDKSSEDYYRMANEYFYSSFDLLESLEALQYLSETKKSNKPGKFPREREHYE